MKAADDDHHLSILLDPLTHRNRAGDVYVRTPDVERQIIEALALPPEAMRKRVAIAERASPDYLSEECLVYLLRYYLRLNDSVRVNDLAAALLSRCAPIVRERLRTLGPDASKEAQSELVTQLFSRILDVSTNKADFLQVRFWVVIKSLCVQEFKRQLGYKRGRNALSFSQLPGYDGEEDEEAETLAVRLTEEDKRRVSTPSGEKAIVDGNLRRVALAQLEEPFLSVFLLRHYEGWPIEDQDPAVPTISRHFGKTPRTIRNWLATAKETLARWQGGQR